MGKRFALTVACVFGERSNVSGIYEEEVSK